MLRSIRVDVLSICVKSVQIRSFFWSVFSCIRTEYGDLRIKSPYSVQMQENADQKKAVFELFSRSDKTLPSHQNLFKAGVNTLDHCYSFVLILEFRQVFAHQVDCCQNFAYQTNLNELINFYSS